MGSKEGDIMDNLKKQKELLNKLKKALSINALTLSMVATLVGCGNKDNDYVVENTTEATTQMTTEATTEMTTEATTQITTEATTESTEKETSKDNEVLEVVRSYKDKIKQFYDDHDIDKIASKGKEYFITLVDFIFYDGEIKGIKYSELKEASKEELYREFCEMDEIIMILAPNYKENISEKYEAVKDFTSDVYYKSLDKIKEYIGEERYDKIGEIKDKAKDKLSETKDKAKEKIKDWYEDFRDSE